MKKRVLPLLTLFALFTLAGCQNTAQVSTTQRLTQVEESYRVVLDTMANARDAGLVSQADLNATRPARVAVDAALAAAEAAVARGDTGAVQPALDAAAAALGQLSPLLGEINRKGPTP